jgi:hypothetical protein
MIISHMTGTLKSTPVINPDSSDTPSAKYFSSLGINILPSPTLPSFPLLFQLQFRGFINEVDVIDGQLETFPEPTENYNFKYITLTRHAFVPLFVVATRATWDRLSSESKDGIRRAASEIQRESFEKGPTFEEATLTELKNQGVQESIGASPDFSYRGTSSEVLQEGRSSFTFQYPDTVELLNAILRLAPRD